MASGSERYLQYIKEVTKGTTPVTPVMQKVRNTGGSGVENARTNVTSNEIRSDRAIITSRLGNNQPNLSVPIEFSYGSYDDWMQGALGGEWLGGVSVTTTVDVTGATIVSDDGSSWLDKGYNVGDYIVVSGLTVTAEDGVYYIQGIGGTGSNTLTLRQADATTAASFTTDIDKEDVTIISGGYGGRVDIVDDEITFTVASSGKTITASEAFWIDAMVDVGDKIYFKGFTETANNGWHEVTGVTATVLTLGGSTLANDTKDSGDLDYSTNSGLLKCGTELDSFTIEEGFTDVSEYVNVKGCEVSSWSLSIQPDTVVTGSFDFQGTKYSGFESSSIASSSLNTNSNPVFDSYTGLLDIPGIVDCVITGFDFTLDNGLNRRYALMVKDACSIGAGRTNITGTINAYFPDSTLADIYDDETEISAKIRLVDLDENAYLFAFPSMKLTSDSRSTTENDVTESVGFQALGSDFDRTTMYIKKQPAL